MHHQDFPGDPPGTGSRKTAFHYRRGSSGASASSVAGGSGVNTVDDNPTQAGSSSPGLNHQPQSQVAGAQVKKKSGFQITSVTSAQINVSGNNSLADDTESYDDMDESHTEDLSSSDMLDVSVSRATDTGVPDRSSSDETLNSLHGVDTPGLVSPNEPLHPHSIPQGAQQHTSMVNGTMHHHYYPQQQSQPHHHHSDSLGGGEPPLPALPIAPVASSSPAMASKAGPSQFQRVPVLDNTKPAGGTTQPIAAIVGETATDPHLQASGNISNVSAVTAAAVLPSGSAGFENTSASGQVVSVGGVTGPSAAAPNTQTQHTQTQTATGSRFRVVKLDTNSEPFRKGRWTCTEYYEKEVSHPAVSEAPKGAELAVESETSNAGISPGIPAVQPLHTLQPYQTPNQDFTSPQAMQSPPQGLAQTTPLTYVAPPEVISGVHMSKPVASVTLPTATPQVTPQAGVGQPQLVIPQQLPYAVDPHQAQTQGGYPAPQLQAGVMTQGTVRQPDFIQPTAPFQTQVQPPLPHVTTGISITQPLVSITQQLPHQGHVAPPAPANFAAGQPQTLPSQLQPHPQSQVQPPSIATVPVAPTHGTPYMPLTALQADLQPLLTPGTTLTQVPGGGSSTRTSQLEDAQKLLLQHQGLLGLPRLGVAAGGEGAAEASGAAGTLAHMGMSAEASAFMAAAAAGLRTQHAEGEEDSSSGASVVAIDNKIEQAMDLVKSHLMYAVREEVEVLKEQIKELIERNTQLEQENNLLKTLASPEQMAQFQAQVQTGGSPTSTAQPLLPVPAGSTQVLPSTQNSGSSA
ncbi:TSC22 domain family protein 1-like isoform X1 [Seriola lalandi dorsalis]|uniref:TSC22 domain family protein 1-like isoform X1 n=1 Tax=Seriola lalandi dorsalis TaxID=1841481 RepID=UPI000C6FA7EF|nr:TSC22 domain family protein 1-like isoform X1 [Seriola lalandi dorsalis]